MAWPLGRARPKQQKKPRTPTDPIKRLELHTTKMALRHLSQRIDSNPELQDALIEKKFGIKINRPTGEESQNRAITEQLLANPEYVQMLVDDRIAELRASKAHSTLDERLEQEAAELYLSDPATHKQVLSDYMKRRFRDGDYGDDTIAFIDKYEALQERFGGGHKQNIFGGLLSNPDIQSAIALMVMKATGVQAPARNRTYVVLDEKGQLVEVDEVTFRQLAAQRAKQLEAPKATPSAVAPAASTTSPEVAPIASTPEAASPDKPQLNATDAVQQLDALLEHMEGPADDFAVLLVQESHAGNVFSQWLANYLLDSTISELKVMLQPFAAHATWGRYISKAFENEAWFSEVQAKVRVLIEAEAADTESEEKPDGEEPA